MAGPITVGISSSLVSTINRLSQDDLNDLLVHGVGISSESITSVELTEVTNTTFTIKWNDPELLIDWPINNPILQLRDK